MTHEEWVKRDADVVWHGFTQMDAFARNSPIIVETAEGRELIDVDGRHYLDAISSLWVTTLGHRVPELDDAIQQQLARGAHSTMLGNGNRIVVELSEALAAVVPVDSPHFLYASDGASAVEQALKIAFQYWVNRGVEGHTTFLAFGGAYHGDTIGALSVGDDLGARTLYHGHSYGGNALAAAVALRHLELIDAWDVLANVRERSEELEGLLHDRIAPMQAVKEVRLRGLMGAVELDPPADGLRWGRRISAAAVERGVLLRSIGDNVTLMPPLTITSEELHRIVHALGAGIDEVTQP